MQNVFEDFKSDSYDSYMKILTTHSLAEIEDAVDMYRIASHSYMTFDEMIQNITNGYSNPVIDEIKAIDRQWYGKETPEHRNELIACLFSMHQFAAQVERFRRSKQVLSFDKDFIEELRNTDDKFTIRYNIFATLPYNNFYIDLSEAKELCDYLGIDGILLQIHSVRTVDNEYWTLNCVFYKGGHSLIVITQVLVNSRDDIELTVQEIVESFVEASNIRETTNVKYNEIFPMLINILLYLCSYEPDIHETVVSKRQRADAKKSKMNKKDYPEQIYKVGERFGASFRKWTAGKLGAEHSKSEGAKKVKPHIRRAHWHRYWYGPRNSPDRELRIRWVHECECNFDKDTEIEAVKHRVKK